MTSTRPGFLRLAVAMDAHSMRLAIGEESHEAVLTVSRADSRLAIFGSVHPIGSYPDEWSAVEPQVRIPC
jgi:hypothetical protein